MSTALVGEPHGKRVLVGLAVDLHGRKSQAPVPRE